MIEDLIHYREYLTDEAKLLDLLLRASSKRFSDIPFHYLPGTKEQIDMTVNFLEIVAENSIKQSVDIVFRNAESEIEKFFLSSLLLGAALDYVFFLILTPPLTSPIVQIEKHREKYKHVLEMIQLLGQISGGDPVQSFIDFVFSQEDTEDNKLSLIAFALEYVALNFHEKFHISIQSTFSDIVVDGKSIRPDIFIWLPSNPDFKLIVECDGYAYHSDKRSFTNDRSRDRILQMKGFQVLRFSGQEIYNDPLSKSIELYNYLLNLQNKK